MKNSQDLYAILGVPHDVDDDTLKAAYRRFARRFHPDVNTNPGASALFRDIAEAYDILSDPVSRGKYDDELRIDGLTPAYFSLRVTPSKRVLRTLEEPQVVYLLAEIIPEPQFANQASREAPLNIALVIDRSTSMKGPRLDQVKQASHRIIDSLGPNDFLSMVSFSDRAELVFEATPVLEKAALRAMASTMQASGGTEIYQGLVAGVEQVRKSASPEYVNHLILLTDGRTYGDETLCLELAQEVRSEGIGISAIGIGQEWNDAFLDDLASSTGGTSTYISSPAAVVRFLNSRVRSLGAAFIERLQLSIAPDADVILEDAFKLTPEPQPLSVDLQSIPLGSLEKDRYTSIILQLQMPALPADAFRTVVRLDATGDILRENVSGYKVVSDFSLEVSSKAIPDNPPIPIMEALGKLTLYRMQQKAQESIARGDVRNATRQLENLATRLLESGQESLAKAAIAEANRVATTTTLSEEGQKTLKYGTRALLLSPPSGTLDSGNEE
jgi:Ca-activated chloride channel family protein